MKIKEKMLAQYYLDVITKNEKLNFEMISALKTVLFNKKQFISKQLNEFWTPWINQSILNFMTCSEQVFVFRD